MPEVTDKILFIEAYATSTPLELVDCYLSVLKYHKYMILTITVVTDVHSADNYLTKNIEK